MKYISITGRLPELSIAELEALYGAEALTRIGDHALVAADVDFSRLGGSVKLARFITTFPTSNPQKALDYCRKLLPDLIKDMPEGKVKLGVSLYGASMPLTSQNAAVLTLKKVIKQTGRSVRAVPNTENALTSAQTYHNSMTSQVGLELVLVAYDDTTYVGHVCNVQDIDSYTLRDRGRPKRDPFVGMLPPKLAQTIINLAVGRWHLEDGSLSSPIANSHITIDHAQHERVARASGGGAEAADLFRSKAEGLAPPVVLDPFCGTGVILQEAILMGYDVYGTDVSGKMIEFSRTNLEWLRQKYETGNRKNNTITLAEGDATSYQWDDLRSRLYHLPSVSIATEGYLGRPIGGQTITPEQLAAIIHECNAIMRGFLKNIAPQLPSGTRLCIAAPVWHVSGHLHHLPVIEELASLGFTRVKFQHVSNESLIYSREDQITHRQLLVLTRS